MVFDREKFSILYCTCILLLSEPDILLHLNAFQKFIKAVGNRFLLRKNTQQIVIPNYYYIADRARNDLKCVEGL